MYTRSRIATIVENMSNVKSQRDLVNDSIAVALDRVYQWFDWPYYIVESNFATVANYTIGTIAINNGSTTGTITTGVVNTNWVNRKIRIGSEKTYYKISAVNTGANTITIAAPYTGTSVTASGYSVYKDEYLLAPNVDKYKTLRQMQNGVPLMSLTPAQFDSILPAPQNLADPIYEVMSGTVLRSYTTGTVSATNKTITGVATAWITGSGLEGVGAMSLIRIGNNVYTIASIDSDTQITTYETVVTVGVGATYEITLNNINIQLYFIPNADRQINYRYFRMPIPLANDYDVPDMPHEFHWILIYGALSLIYLQKGDINKAQQESEMRFINGLEMMKMKLGTFAPNRIYRRKSVDSMRRRRFEGVENSNYDWRYSAY